MRNYFQGIFRWYEILCALDIHQSSSIFNCQQRFVPLPHMTPHRVLGTQGTRARSTKLWRCLGRQSEADMRRPILTQQHSTAEFLCNESIIQTTFVEHTVIFHRMVRTTEARFFPPVMLSKLGLGSSLGWKGGAGGAGTRGPSGDPHRYLMISKNGYGASFCDLLWPYQM